MIAKICINTMQAELANDGIIVDMVKVEQAIKKYAEHNVGNVYFVDEGDLNHPCNDDAAIELLHDELYNLDNTIEWYEYTDQ